MGNGGALGEGQGSKQKPFGSERSSEPEECETSVLFLNGIAV